MRNRSLFAGFTVLVVAACAGGDSAISDDLKRDLEASSSAIELAGQANAQPLMTVSELEQGRTAEEVQKKPQPRRVARNTVGTEPQEEKTPAPEPQQEVQVASNPEPQQVEAPAPEASAVPSVAPRPASLPVNVPSTGGSGMGSGGIGTGDRGVGIGDVIGVVIRGGGVGPDHCPPPRRGRIPGRRFP